MPTMPDDPDRSRSDRLLLGWALIVAIVILVAIVVSLAFR
jgi:hypothetical protein